MLLVLCDLFNHQENPAVLLFGLHVLKTLLPLSLHCFPRFSVAVLFFRSLTQSKANS